MEFHFGTAWVAAGWKVGPMFEQPDRELEPKYSKISDEEMKDLEAEFGHHLTLEMALWLIRLKTQRSAIQRMIGEEHRMIEEESPQNKRAA